MQFFPQFFKIKILVTATCHWSASENIGYRTFSQAYSDNENNNEMMTNDWNNKTKHCVSSVLQNKATSDKNRNILAASICVYHSPTNSRIDRPLKMTSDA